jgi:hypothetical protein
MPPFLPGDFAIQILLPATLNAQQFQELKPSRIIPRQATGNSQAEVGLFP